MKDAKQYLQDNYIELVKVADIKLSKKLEVYAYMYFISGYTQEDIVNEQLSILDYKSEVDEIKSVLKYKIRNTNDILVIGNLNNHIMLETLKTVNYNKSLDSEIVTLKMICGIGVV